MTFLRKNGEDMVNDATKLVFMHADCAAHILKEAKREVNTNIALYSLAVIVKISLAVACRKHRIGFSGNDPIELLFKKTCHVLPHEIAVISKNICYWHNELPYEHEPAMSSDKGYEAGKKIQDFYNEYIVGYLDDLCREDEPVVHRTNKIEKF